MSQQATTSAILTAAADSLERREGWKTARDLRNGAGPAMFELLFETAKQIYGWTAIQHLQRHIGHEQLQDWRETDPPVVTKTLREAAQQPPRPDLEVQALRAKLDNFHQQLAQGMGWLTYDVSTLVRETAREVSRLRQANERLERQLHEERARHRTPAGGRP